MKNSGSSSKTFVQPTDIARALWGNPHMFDLAENLTQFREYHREQFSNWSKIDSLWFGHLGRIFVGDNVRRFEINTLLIF
jgi:hypothetical protein